jgi:hypothetical protein
MALALRLTGFAGEDFFAAVVVSLFCFFAFRAERRTRVLALGLEFAVLLLSVVVEEAAVAGTAVITDAEALPFIEAIAKAAPAIDGESFKMANGCVEGCVSGLTTCFEK